MVFSSPSFLFVFLPLVMALYFAVRGMAAKNLVLPVLSLLFYAWGERQYAVVLIGSITAVSPAVATRSAAQRRFSI